MTVIFSCLRSVVYPGSAPRLVRSLIAGVVTAALLANTAPAQETSHALDLLPGDLVFTRPAEVSGAGSERGALAWRASTPVLELRSGTPAPARFRGQIWAPPRLQYFTADRLGQVFGLALRSRLARVDGRSTLVVDVFVAATSAYGLAITEPDPEAPAGIAPRPRRPSAHGGAAAAWAPAQWGQGGGPGSVYLIDGASGRVRLFADLAPLGRPNNGAGLGNLVWDARHGLLFVSDRDSGLILALGPDGRERDRFDHGTTGRPAAGLAPVQVGVDRGAPMKNVAFSPLRPESWQMAAPERRPWGLAVNGGRLYYAIAKGPSLWSVGIDPMTGRFEDDARIEIDLGGSEAEGAEISDLVFTPEGDVIMALRRLPSRITPGERLTVPSAGPVLRFMRLDTGKDGDARWEKIPEMVAVGHGAMREGDGGLALGPAIGGDGQPLNDRELCRARLFVTGSNLAVADHDQRRGWQGGLPRWQSGHRGIQITPAGLAEPANMPPTASIVVDIPPATPGAGLMGDVEVHAPCKSGADLDLLCAAQGWLPPGGAPFPGGEAPLPPGGIPLPPGGGAGGDKGGDGHDGPPFDGQACLKTEPVLACNGDGAVSVTLNASSPGALMADMIKIVPDSPGVSVAGGPLQPLGNSFTLQGLLPGQSVSLDLCAFQAVEAATGEPFDCCRSTIEVTAPDCQGDGTGSDGPGGGGGGQEPGPSCLSPEISDICLAPDGIHLSIGGASLTGNADTVKITPAEPGASIAGGPLQGWPADVTVNGIAPGQTLSLSLCAFSSSDAASGMPFDCCRGNLQIQLSSEIPPCPQ